MNSLALSAFRTRGPALLALLALGSLLSCAREHFSPVELTNPGRLSLTVNIPCATVSSATVFVDGRTVGEMKIPGAFDVYVPIGSHTFQIGAYSYVIQFQVDHDQVIAFYNASFHCPSTTP
jgi:hypothetical protein